MKTKKLGQFETSNSYPFVNPIIINKENTIIDGQCRVSVCKYIGADINCIKIDSENDIEAIQAIQEEQRLRLEVFFKTQKCDFRYQLAHSSSNDKMSKFIEFKNLITSDKEYWEKLADCYQHTNNNFRFLPETKKLFNVNRPCKQMLMDNKEQRFLKKLDKKITIYRGMTVDEAESENFGISWTLNKAVAEKFAYKFLHNYDSKDKNKTVMELTISKDQVIACFLSRQEEEIIYMAA